MCRPRDKRVTPAVMEIPRFDYLYFSVYFQYILSYIMYPFAFVMGARPEDCLLVGNLLGIKTLSNSGVAYIYLSKIIDNSETFADYTAIENNTWRYIPEGIMLDNINVTLEGGIMSVSSEKRLLSIDVHANQK